MNWDEEVMTPKEEAELRKELNRGLQVFGLGKKRLAKWINLVIRVSRIPANLPLGQALTQIRE